MWDEQKRGRFQFLRQRELDGALTQAEQTELLQMVREIEHAESASLHLAMERLRGNREETVISSLGLVRADATT